MAKQKSEDVVICFNVAFPSKEGLADTRMSNRIYSFSPDDTWDDVLGDLLRELDDGYRLGKSDSVEVRSLQRKMLLKSVSHITKRR